MPTVSRSCAKISASDWPRNGPITSRARSELSATKPLMPSNRSRLRDFIRWNWRGSAPASEPLASCSHTLPEVAATVRCDLRRRPDRLRISNLRHRRRRRRLPRRRCGAGAGVGEGARSITSMPARRSVLRRRGSPGTDGVRGISVSRVPGVRENAEVDRRSLLPRREARQPLKERRDARPAAGHGGVDRDHRAVGIAGQRKHEGAHAAGRGVALGSERSQRVEGASAIAADCQAQGQPATRFVAVEPAERCAIIVLRVRLAAEQIISEAAITGDRRKGAPSCWARLK